MCLKGEPGTVGAQGIQGDAGPKGLKGDHGLPGQQGPQGSRGIKGEKGDQFKGCENSMMSEEAVEERGAERVGQEISAPDSFVTPALQTV